MVSKITESEVVTSQLHRKVTRTLNLRRGPVRFLSAGGGGNAKCSHGLSEGSVYPVKYLIASAALVREDLTLASVLLLGRSYFICSLRADVLLLKVILVGPSVPLESSPGKQPCIIHQLIWYITMLKCHLTTRVGKWQPRYKNFNPTNNMSQKKGSQKERTRR